MWCSVLYSEDDVAWNQYDRVGDRCYDVAVSSQWKHLLSREREAHQSQEVNETYKAQEVKQTYRI